MTMTRFYLYLLLSGCTVLLASCKSGNDAGEILQLEVAAHKTQCVGAGPTRTCLRARRDDQAWFEDFHEKIEGFDFQWGVKSTLKVEQRTVENPSEDGSAFEYRLVEVIDETEAAPQETFLLPLLYPGQALEQVSPQPDIVDHMFYELFGEVELSCEMSVCFAYGDAVDVEDNAVLLTVMFDRVDPLDLDLVEVTCIAPRDSFGSTCGPVTTD